MIDEDESSSGASESKAPASQPIAEPTSEPDRPSVEPGGLLVDDQGRIYVGSTVETDYFSITYGECDSDWKGYNGSHFGPDKGKKIIRAYFSFKNIDTRDHDCYMTDFNCYADNIACDLYFAWYGRDDKLDPGEISPGRIGQGYVYFEVPVDAEEIELEYSSSFRGPTELIFIVE